MCVCDSNCSRKGKMTQTAKWSVAAGDCSGAGVFAVMERMERQSTEDLQGSEITLYDTIMMDTCP